MILKRELKVNFKSFIICTIILIILFKPQCILKYENMPTLLISSLASVITDRGMYMYFALDSSSGILRYSYLLSTSS